MLRQIGLMICLLAAVCGADRALADAASEAAALKARYLAAAQEARDRGALIRDSINGVAADHVRLGGFILEDLIQARQAANAEGVIYEKIAAAYEKSDPAEVIRLRKEVDAAARNRILWRDRITDIRKRQFEAAPTEQWYQERFRFHGTVAPAAINAWAEARKAAAEAWGRVAEATVPGADPNALFALTEVAYVADMERDIAEIRYNWVVQRETWLLDKRITSDELSRRLAELQKLQDARLALKREENAQARRVREAERTLHETEAAVRKALEAAQIEFNEKEKAKAANR